MKTCSLRIVLIATIVFLVTAFWYYDMRLSQPPKVAKWDSAASLYLPPDLEVTTLARFDDLVSSGEVLWEPSEVQVHDDHGFKVSTQDIFFVVYRPTAMRSPNPPIPPNTLIPHNLVMRVT